MRRQTMHRLRRKSLRLVLFLALIVVLPASRPGPLALDTKTDDKKQAKLDIIATPENARRIEFSTDEGTWMSLDVSPDGRTILFDLLGDIHRVGIAGGKAERVTSGPAFDYAPRYSPDGRTIVFCSDRGGDMNLWLMNADGSRPHALTEEKDAIFSSPSWTPDGLYVLARREDTSKAGIPPVEIFMFHRDGGSGIKIIAKDKIDTSAGPIASPDGRYIYLTGRKADFSYTPNMTNGLWHVFRFDRKTGELVQLTTAPDGGLRPTLSPDGKAGKPRRLTKDTAREYAPEFSPDGRSIAYVTWADADLGHVWKIRASGGAPVRLTRTAGHYANPAWSPKGDRIAIVAGSGAELRGQQPEFDR